MELEYVNEHIGRKIKDLRNQNGLTQQELADRTELTKGFISQLERGQVSPSVGTLLDLIECLGTTASDFFKETEEEQIVFSENGFFETAVYSTGFTGCPSFRISKYTLHPSLL